MSLISIYGAALEAATAFPTIAAATLILIIVALRWFVRLKPRQRRDVILLVRAIRGR